MGNTIGTYYDPCFIQSSGFPVANKDNVYFAIGVNNVAPGVSLYESYNDLFTNITSIANSAGAIFAVSAGVVQAQFETC